MRITAKPPSLLPQPVTEAPTGPSEGLWRNLDYVWWLSTDTGGALARSLHNFAVPLLALYVTGSPVQAGMVAAIGQVGRLLTTVPGGVLADRYNRRRLIVIGAASGAVLALALAAMQLAGFMSFWLLSTLNLLMNIRGGLFDSTTNAALKSVVAPRSVGSAVAANEGRDAVVALSGGPLGGVLMVLGHAVPFLVTCILEVISALSVLRIRADLRPAREPAARTGYLNEAREGLSWLFHRPELRGVMIISTIVNLGINAALTTVVFGLQQRGESPATIGLTTSAIGVGMLAGALVAPVLVRRVPTGRLSALGLIFVAGSVAVLPFVQTLPAICAALAASMVAAPAINASLLGYFMVAVPTRLLGRATSALDVLAMGAVPLAPLVAGFGYAAWGWAGALVLCSGICATAAVLAMFDRGLRTLPNSERWPDHAAEIARTAQSPGVRRRRTDRSVPGRPIHRFQGH
ncbi:MFS transporter [Paeniglutamicibacter antarcticus]|uniref:MFS transporter n=1 Tax=Arthrobacter terrae TaxID=2935737 RepID=A0A931G2Z2_9MICC|nr:MFS transporter [Arthrobacter terrae]MBG0738071.1 MFS transporter [Arthrobacter terrae]